MRATRIEATGFRNLARIELELPAPGAVFLGANAQGKTNLLEALYYPVLFRSLRGANDMDLIRHGDPAFHLKLQVTRRGGTGDLEAGFASAGRRKRVAADGSEPARATDLLGSWLAVAFLPSDLALVTGGAAERRQFLDRVLSLSSPSYLPALRRYRAAVEQRNAALRRGDPESAWAFDPLLARFGSAIVADRLIWVHRYGAVWAAHCESLGEIMPVAVRYQGHSELVDPEAWSSALRQARARDLARGSTNVGPHRDDLRFELGEVPLRVSGSTGQQRTAAIALKLCERGTLEATHVEPPALLLDDVFAELDRERQDRLAARLGIGDGCQVFVTAPRVDELPPKLGLQVFEVVGGRVARQAQSRVA
jgi:DNA replication and repair protein RecF